MQQQEQQSNKNVGRVAAIDEIKTQTNTRRSYLAPDHVTALPPIAPRRQSETVKLYLHVRDRRDEPRDLAVSLLAHKLK